VPTPDKISGCGCSTKRPITVGLREGGAVQQESAATSSIYNGSTLHVALKLR
jgi:hypothetical protein